MEIQTGFTERSKKAVIIMLAIITVILIGYTLRIMMVVTMPVACALYIAMLLFPIQDWLSRHLPDRLHWLSIVLTMLVLIAVVALFIGVFWISIELVSKKAPQYSQLFQGYWDQVLSWAQQHGIQIDQLKSQSIGQRVMSLVGSLFRSVRDILALLVLVFFLTLLLLLEWREWRETATTIFKSKNAEKLLDTLRVVSVKVRRYLWIRTMLGLITSILLGTWLWLVNVDFAFLWAVLAFFLNYLPNVGSIIAGIPPIGIALVQHSWSWALLAAAGILIIEQTMGNFVDPRLQGKQLELSPFVVLVSLIFWGWVWGVIGALLAVPLTVTILVICAHYTPLKPIALLLSRTSDPEEMEKETHLNSMQ